MAPPPSGFGSDSPGGSRGGQIPRREHRYVVPAISISIQVDFNSTDDLFVGRLWDVSQSGACLLFPARCAVRSGMEGYMTIHHPSVGAAIRARARLLWTDRLNTVVYAGALFLEPVNFAGTFLNILMQGPRGAHSLPQLIDPAERPDVLP